MKLTDIHEMATRGGDLTATADTWASKMEFRISSATDKTKLGNIDDLEVFKWGMYVSVWDDSSMIAIARVEDMAGEYCVIDNVWVSSSYRGKKIFVKLLAFIKNEMKFPRIMLGKIHSDDTYNILKNGGLSAFKKTWVHIVTDKNAPFSLDALNDFYGDSKWSLFLENYEDWSIFINENGFTHSYEALANAISLNNKLI